MRRHLNRINPVYKYIIICSKQIVVHLISCGGVSSEKLLGYPTNPLTCRSRSEELELVDDLCRLRSPPVCGSRLRLTRVGICDLQNFPWGWSTGALSFTARKSSSLHVTPSNDELDDDPLETETVSVAIASPPAAPPSTTPGLLAAASRLSLSRGASRRPSSCQCVVPLHPSLSRP